MVKERATTPFKKSIETLAGNYQRAIDKNIDTLANQGDLEAVNALRGEKASVKTLEENIANQGVGDLTLPPLAKDAPAPLVKLRQTWDGALANYRKIHDGEVGKLSRQFAKSLRAFEVTLTKAKQFDQANLVKTYREGISPGAGAAVVQTPEKRGLVKNTSMNLAAATWEKPFVNSLGMHFVPVPISGGPSDGNRVLFSVWETRVSDYEEFIKDERREWQDAGFPQKDDHPAVHVSWEDSTAFCEWLTREDRKKGKIGPNDHYRLPTDHEWSCAVGIGIEKDPDLKPSSKDNNLGQVYPWGKEWPPPPGSGNYYGETKINPLPDRKPIAGYDDGHDWTAPVGSYPLEHHGIRDLGGNVSEWCGDWFDDNQEKRVLRGASWAEYLEGNTRSACRFSTVPSFRGNWIGFRCVCVEG